MAGFSEKLSFGNFVEFLCQSVLEFWDFFLSFNVLLSFFPSLFVFYYIKIHFRHQVNLDFPKNLVLREQNP